MKRKIFFALGLIFISCVIFLLFFGRAFPSSVKIRNQTAGETNSLKISENIFYRQTINNCGPYSVMAVINILTGEEKNPEQLAEQTKWRIIKNLTLPQGVLKLLRENQIKTKDYILKNKSNEEKILWLKNQIDDEKPAIVLVKTNHTLHYFTVLGYDNDGFMIYDSLQEKRADNPRMTIVDRAEYSGNRYYENETLMEIWNAGGYKIFFKNWAAVCDVSARKRATLLRSAY